MVPSSIPASRSVSPEPSSLRCVALSKERARRSSRDIHTVQYNWSCRPAHHYFRHQLFPLPFIPNLRDATVILSHLLPLQLYFIPICSPFFMPSSSFLFCILLFVSPLYPPMPPFFKIILTHSRFFLLASPPLEPVVATSSSSSAGFDILADSEEERIRTKGTK